MIAKKKKLRKRKLRNITISILSAIFVLGFIFILASSDLKLKKRRNKILQKIEEVQKEIKGLEKENQTFKAKVFQQGTKDYLEKEAREKYNLKKPGEEVAVIVEPKGGQTPLSARPEEKKKGLWQQVLEFFHNF